MGFHPRKPFRIHNFISITLVSTLKLLKSLTTSYRIVVGNETKVLGQGISKSVILKLSEMSIEEDFLPLELGGVDVILGMLMVTKNGHEADKLGSTDYVFRIGGKSN